MSMCWLDGENCPKGNFRSLVMNKYFKFIINQTNVFFFCFQNFSSVRDRQKREHYEQINCKNLTIINKNIHTKPNKKWYPRRLESKKKLSYFEDPSKTRVCVYMFAIFTIKTDDTPPFVRF